MKWGLCPEGHQEPEKVFRQTREKEEAPLSHEPLGPAVKKVNGNEAQPRDREARGRGPPSGGREQGTRERAAGSEGKSRRATKTCGLEDTRPDEARRRSGRRRARFSTQALLGRWPQLEPSACGHRGEEEPEVTKDFQD